MNCPVCGSANSEWVQGDRQLWPLGGRRCIDCGRQGSWLEFMRHSPSFSELKEYQRDKPLSAFHPKDVEYFTEYPAPVMQTLQALHFTNINSTITFFGPMLYFVARAMGCERILEIGHAEGYTAFYLAHALKDNATRFGMKDNRYYGIDIVQTERTRTALEAHGLPVTLLNLDSMQLTPDTFPGVKFDLIFQDGNHDTEHVLYELKTMYPQLKGEGRGLWIFHDCYGPAEEGFREVEKLIRAGVYDFQYTCLQEIYGLAILRKMEGYDYEKRHWWDSQVKR